MPEFNPLQIRPPPGTPEANNPLAPDWMRNVGSAAADWMQRQHTLAQQMGYEDPATGLPTALGLRNAMAQYPNALVAGSGGPGSSGIRAFHGSPYDFNAFDLSKIGTGEGAQAYGHGLYFAENEGVAQSYRDNLTVSTPGADPAAVNAFIDKHGGNANRALRALLDAGSGANDPMFQALLHYRDSGVRPSAGHMYELAIHADPEHFLDWDKPLSEQHPKVQDAIVPHVQKAIDTEMTTGTDPLKFTGGEALSALAATTPDFARGGYGHRDASATLHAAGIPGIKYLDQGSRSSGQGTSNYVIFDPKTIEILRKYGIAGLMAGGAAAAAAVQPSNPEQ